MASNAPEPGAHGWTCSACHHENQAHYKFCLGCGGAQREGGGAPVERMYDGNPTNPRQRSPVVLIVVVVIILLAGAIAGVAVMILA
jgi:hypothetical protein